MAEQIEKTIWQILESMCSDLKYGEITLKITVHNGRGISFEETQPAIRKFREIRKEI